MRVLVCGGRNYQDMDKVTEVLDEIHQKTPITVIIHGCANGADSLAAFWATDNDIPQERFPADWQKHGKTAGFMRNQQMLDTNPDLVVAFPGGNGTRHMIGISEQAGKIVRNIYKEMNEGP